MTLRFALTSLFVAVLFALGLWAGIEYGNDLGRVLSSWIGAARREAQSWFGPDDTKSGRRLSFPKSEYDGRDRGTPQNLGLGGFEALWEAATPGQRTNFQDVLTFPEKSSIRRLSHAVGRLDLKADQTYACTAFLVSPDYALTAGHCFYQEDVLCSSADSPSPDKLLKIVDAKIVFNYHGADRFGSHGDAPEINIELKALDPKKPDVRVPAELVCDHDIDYALIKLAPAEAEKIRAAGIQRVRLGDTPVEKRHQLLMLHYPDGRGLMATERNCMSTDVPTYNPTVFGHYCDTLPGSSGAPVFSRDHEVVVALHVSSQVISSAGEPQDSGAENRAVRITKIVARSPILRSLDLLIHDPLTAEQQNRLDDATKRAKDAEALIQDGRTTLAARVVLDSLRSIKSRQDLDALLAKAPDLEAVLQNALYSQQEVATFSSSLGAIAAVAISGDGSRVAAASSDNTVQVWEAETGTRIANLKGHTGQILSAAFSPDGSRVLTASSDRSARLWDAQTGKLIRTLSGNSGPVIAASFSEDGGLIITASATHNARLWNGHSGDFIKELRGNSGNIIAAAFNSTGDRVVAACDNGTAGLWDTRSGQLVSYLPAYSAHTLKPAMLALNQLSYSLMKSHAAPISAIFSSDGHHVVTTTDNGAAAIWDARTGSLEKVLDRSSSFGSPLITAAMNDVRVVTASEDGTADLWDSKTGALISTLQGHNEGIVAAAFGADGRRVTTVSRDQDFRVWDGRNGEFIARLRGHSARFSAIAFDRKASRAISASGQLASLWDLRSGPFISELAGHTGSVNAANFNVDGGLIVTASSDNTARVWEGKNGRLVRVLKGHANEVRDASFSPDGNFIVTASDDQTARLWNAHSGQLVRELEGHRGSVRSAVFNSDGSLIVTASYDSTARLWDGRTGAFIKELKGHGDGIERAVFSPSDDLVATLSNDHTVRLWRTRTGDLVRELKGHDDDVLRGAFSPNSKLMVTVAADGTARLWNIETGQPTKELTGHRLAVSSAVFSGDGGRILTASSDHTARLWDKNGMFLRELNGHIGAVNNALFSDHDRVMVTSSADGSIRLWNGQTGAAIAVLSERNPPPRSQVTGFISNWLLRVKARNSGTSYNLVSGAVGEAAVNGDLSRVVTTSRYGTALLWTVLPRGQALVDLAQRRFSRVMPTESECREFGLDCSISSDTVARAP